jgi:small subunit ribosomal protein S8
MNISDPIADMLTRIRNANQALHEKVEMPSSKMRSEIARILRDEGYIDAVDVNAGQPYDTLVLTLRYGPNRERVISGLKRVSKPGRRIYAKADRPHRVLGGLGVAILSTSSGLLSGRQALERGVGGEVLCYVW